MLKKMMLDLTLNLTVRLNFPVGLFPLPCCFGFAAVFNSSCDHSPGNTGRILLIPNFGETVRC